MYDYVAVSNVSLTEANKKLVLGDIPDHLIFKTILLPRAFVLVMANKFSG